MGKFNSLEGQKFGKLTVLHKSSFKKNNKIVWKCKCDCGNEVFIVSSNLTRKNKPTQSCGCIKSSLNKTRNLKHNKRNCKLYAIWSSMKQRCYNSNSNNYKYYGQIGINVCDEWKNNFMNFYNWAIENGYDETKTRKEQSLDRINNNGNYEPNNCRWVDMKVQANNKRNKTYRH